MNFSINTLYLQTEPFEFIFLYTNTRAHILRQGVGGASAKSHGDPKGGTLLYAWGESQQRESEDDIYINIEA